MAAKKPTAADLAAADAAKRFQVDGETLTLRAAIQRVTWRTVGPNFYRQLPTGQEAKQAAEIVAAFDSAAVGSMRYGMQRVA